MHELSIAMSLVELAEDAARRAGAARVVSVQLRLGALAGVVREALEFSFPLAAAGTLLADARLEIEELPLVIGCGVCGRDVRPAPGEGLRCPRCGAPSGLIRQGRELELVGLEIAEPTLELEVAP